MRVAPHLGSLPGLTATFPHPKGTIQVKYERHGANLDATVGLPEGLTGDFVLGAFKRPLKAGENHFNAPFSGAGAP